MSDESVASTIAAGDATEQARRCRHCGVGLGELGEQSLCPQCGLPVIVSVRGSEAGELLDDAGNVTGDTPCGRCGYNLRGLARTGVCPECATPVQLSVHRDLLCFAEPRYVRKLARGNRLVLWGLNLWALALLTGIGAGLVASLLSRLSIGVVGFAVSGVVLIAAVGCGLAGWIVFLLGVWGVTVPQPGVFDTGRQDASRRLVRVSLLVSLVGIVVGATVDAFAPPLIIRGVVEIGGLGFWVLLVVATRAFFRHMLSVARRVPHAKMAGRASTLAVSWPTVLGLLTVLVGVGRLIMWGPFLLSGGQAPVGPAASPAAGGGSGPMSNVYFAWFIISSCGTVLLSLVALILLMLAARMHRYLVKPLRQQAVLAAIHWRSGAVGGRAGEGAGAQGVQA